MQPQGNFLWVLGRVMKECREGRQAASGYSGYAQSFEIVGFGGGAALGCSWRDFAGVVARISGLPGRLSFTVGFGERMGANFGQGS